MVAGLPFFFFFLLNRAYVVLVPGTERACQTQVVQFYYVPEVWLAYFSSNLRSRVFVYGITSYGGITSRVRVVHVVLHPQSL